MKIRTLSIACVATGAALLAACTSASRNTGACEQLMRNKLADTSSETLRVDHRAAAIRGSRVVVEGTIEHVVPVPAASAVPASASASAAVTAAVPQAPAAAALPASAAQAASGVSAASTRGKPAKPKTVMQPAAAECTFDGEQLSAFRWLAPARLATPDDQPAT